MSITVRVSDKSIAFAGCNANQIKEIAYIAVTIEANLYTFHPLPDGISFLFTNIDNVNQVLNKIGWQNYDYKPGTDCKNIELNF